MKKTVIYILIQIAAVFSSHNAFSSDDPVRLTPQDYIVRYKDDAIRDMQKTGVPASITLAQGMYESQNGNSDLARKANNHFGIKCHKEWNGPTFIKDDDTKDECFRKYATVLESFDDHSNFLRTRDRYKFLFEYDIRDYKKWAHGLKKAGYATNPEYAYKLIKIIEENNLHELDNNGPLALAVPVTKSKPVAVKKSETTPTASVQPLSIVDNNIRYVVAKKGDSYLSIANEQDMMLWELFKYNDADKGTTLSEGEVVYLKPKRNSAKTDFHIIKEGETMRSIAQKYGIKVKHLYKRNHIALYTEPSPGTRLSLNKTVN